MLKNSKFLFPLLLLSTSIYASPEQPQPPSKSIQTLLLAEITAQGQKVNGVALEYEDNILSGNDLRKTYQIYTAVDSQEKQARTILRAYVNDRPELTAHPHAGKFVVIELDEQDRNADLYMLKTENDKPMSFRAKDDSGKIVLVEKTQATKVPEYYGDRLTYYIEQTGFLKLTNGKTLEHTQIQQTAVKSRVKTPFLDQFVAKQVTGKNPDNQLAYQLYVPEMEANRKYPLTIFLHGSGQVGTDNLAHLLSSLGAIATLPYEQGFVLAPQYSTVFDPFDDVNKGQKGGIHWQTDNRINLLLNMIDDTVKNNPTIDPNRIYCTGLSRGAEGCLNLLLKRPRFFAAALLASGREAHTVEWIDGNASKENLAAIKDVPMWFFHSKEDKISPVQGSRINVQLLTELGAKHTNYTEFTTEQVGDNGILNNNPHNTWDAVFSSPEVMRWLLSQYKTP
ncbi:alpha/beta hydrolase-fold protein [Lonepinella sp. BR2357]|uniref:alpha/beta hydrolase-fold protein n=1 Tax=Lonepinella sp. BR2357 TaxID=3434549 RepID=UPI003F6E359F